MSVSAFDHPFLSGLFGDEATARFFAASADIDAMLTFEAALAEAESLEGVIPAEAGNAIAVACPSFKPSMAALKEGTAHDGVVVPALVEALRQVVGEPHAAHVHFGATSQDVIDTSLVLRLRDAIEVIERRLDSVLAKLDALGQRFGANALTGVTRMQAALPITAADRIASWRDPLARHKEQFQTVKADLLRIQFGGAAGTLEKLGEKGPAVRARMAATLDLADAPQWHSQRDELAAFASWLSLVTGALGKIGQDIALMAQTGIREIALAGGGGSSAMPHKQNPVRAEILVTLARFNATQLSGLHHALVHECERSGAAWSLEWLLLPPMVVAAGAALARAEELIGMIVHIGRDSAAAG